MAYQMYRKAYNIIFFRFLMENSIVKKFGSVDAKIAPDFCSVVVKTNSFVRFLGEFEDTKSPFETTDL